MTKRELIVSANLELFACPGQLDFFFFFSGRLFLFVDAKSLSSFLLIDSYISFDAPLSEDFLRSPRFAERAAPAACCWAFDFAGMKRLHHGCNFIRRAIANWFPRRNKTTLQNVPKGFSRRCVMPETKPAQEQDHQPGHESKMRPPPDYEPRFRGAGRLDGKVAIITGGDSGIGRACSVLFAHEGADVAIVYLEEDDDALKTQKLVQREKREALLLRGDIADPEFCKSSVSETLKALGRIDVLVNNAAEQHPTDDFEAIAPAQIRRTFETNVFGYFYMTQAVLPHLKEGSAIVNTTSITAYRGSKHLMDYSATRGAIVAFTRSMAQYCAPRKIRVNGVAPGPIWTPLIPASFDAERVAEFGADQPLGRPGEPNEVASCHLFLACDDSSYMTGQVLHPNGGEIVGG